MAVMIINLNIVGSGKYLRKTSLKKKRKRKQKMQRKNDHSLKTKFNINLL